MKFLRLGAHGQERPAALDSNGQARDLSSLVDDISSENLANGRLAAITQAQVDALPLAAQDQRIGACVANPSKFLAIGLNYHDHAAETGATAPAEPMLFNKSLSSICGPNDPLVLPRGSEHCDWEIELGIIIGRYGKYIPQDQALEHVFGFCTVTDFSERDWQKNRAGQFTKGKSADSFGPIGPWIVTKDEIKDPQNLRLWLDLNGTRMQDGSSADMIFSAVQIVSYLSQMLTLLPGDIITTGTPAGVGMGRTPPRYLKVGDQLHMGVELLGNQRKIVIRDPYPAPVPY